MATKPLPTEGRFRCPKCYQPYDVTPETIGVVRRHLWQSHEIKVDARWVRRRLTPKETDG